MQLIAKWDITGLWIGHYTYHPNDEFPTLPPEVSFRFMARQGWFGRVSGTIQDDPVTGIPGEASVRGWISATGVTFQKQYPVCYVQTAGSCISLRDALLSQGFTLDSDIRPAPIRYTGVYDSATGMIEGTWRVKRHRVRFLSGGRTMGFMVEASSGDWLIKRQPS